MGLDWTVESARLTLFLSEQRTISDEDWAAITGQDEAETRQALPGGRRLSGPVPSGVMHLSAIGSRFDVILAAAAEIAEGEEVQLPSVGSYDDTFTSFFEGTCKWIAKVGPSVTRIAFGAVLTCKAQSREETYGHLRELLKSLKVDPRMRELQFRVNWPGESRVDQGLIVNRLTTWSAVRFVRKFIQIGPGTVAGDDAGHINAIRLEMDHNTDEAKKDIFDQGKLVPIYSELVELGRQNAAEGEVPSP